MKKIITLFIQLVVCSVSAQTISHEVSDDRFQMIGRWDKSSSARYVADLSGSEVRFRFVGTKVSVRLRQYKNTWFTSYADVIIDGLRQDSLKLNTSWHLIFESEIADTHTVSLFKRSEAFMGDMAFDGIELDGELLGPEPLKKLNFLFTGSSWETGFGNTANLSVEESSQTGFTTDRSNSYFSYPAILSRDYGAEFSCACYSGKGLFRAFDGDTVNQLPEIFFKTLAELSSSVFDMQSDIPDVVFVDYGSNDFSVGVPDKEQFVSEYVTFLDSVRTTYPEAKIVISLIHLSVLEEITDSAYFKTSLDYLQTVFDDFSSRDNEVYFWKYSEIGIKTWGQDLHPNIDLLTRIAADLSTFLQDNTSVLLSTDENVMVNNKLSVFPNPSNGIVNVLGEENEFDYKIFNSQGISVKEGRTSNNKFLVTELNAGVYVLKIGEFNTKLLIE